MVVRLPSIHIGWHLNLWTMFGGVYNNLSFTFLAATLFVLCAQCGRITTHMQPVPGHPNRVIAVKLMGMESLTPELHCSL